MEMLNEPLMQLGAVGIMIGVFVIFLRSREKELSAERDSRLKRDQFIEDLVGKAQEREDANLDAWKGMTGEFITGQKGLTDSLKEFTNGHQELCEVVVNGNAEMKKKMQQDHAALHGSFFQVEQALSKLETTVSEQHGEIMGRIGGR